MTHLQLLKKLSPAPSTLLRMLMPCFQYPVSLCFFFFFRGFLWCEEYPGSNLVDFLYATGSPYCDFVVLVLSYPPQTAVFVFVTIHLKIINSSQHNKNNQRRIIQGTSVRSTKPFILFFLLIFLFACFTYLLLKKTWQFFKSEIDFVAKLVKACDC